MDIEKVLVRIPFVFLMIVVLFVDRINIGFAGIKMVADLTGAASEFLGIFMPHISSLESRAP
ncbi:hypothetical protein [Caballeronia sp. DA-9]|uniref:hypothetical protein n=1 Tax=Caballeronia sp. DA-9 TaxID=3436237 RepID=UPI003F67CDCA